jgi:hypothetical protein
VLCVGQPGFDSGRESIIYFYHYLWITGVGTAVGTAAGTAVGTAVPTAVVSPDTVSCSVRTDVLPVCPTVCQYLQRGQRDNCHFRQLSLTGR